MILFFITEFLPNVIVERKGRAAKDLSKSRLFIVLILIFVRKIREFRGCILLENYTERFIRQEKTVFLRGFKN
jgi:hypothetical protein